MPLRKESILQNNKHSVIDAYYLVNRLRYRYKVENDEKNESILDRIMWYSIPLVYGDKEWKEVSRAAQNRKAKKRRANGYLFHMQECYEKLYFVTFTFNDDTFSKTLPSTRKKYCQRWLEEFTRDYFANEDFGAKNGREHYHAVVALTDELSDRLYLAISNLERVRASMTPDEAKKVKISDFEAFSWQYGFFGIKPVAKFTDAQQHATNTYKLSSYLTKLANHSGKLTTGKRFHKRGMKDVDNIPFL